MKRLTLVCQYCDGTGRSPHNKKKVCKICNGEGTTIIDLKK